jgi:hypothetical protein
MTTSNRTHSIIINEQQLKHIKRCLLLGPTIDLALKQDLDELENPINEFLIDMVSDLLYTSEEDYDPTMTYSFCN